MRFEIPNYQRKMDVEPPFRQKHSDCSHIDRGFHAWIPGRRQNVMEVCSKYWMVTRQRDASMDQIKDPHHVEASDARTRDGLRL